MPGMTGPDLQRHLAASGHRRPIIFITAYAEPAARTQAHSPAPSASLPSPSLRRSCSGWIDTALGQDIEQKP